MFNSTQLVVETDKNTIKWLVSQGFENPHNLPKGYAFPVFVVDVQRRRIHGTNATCMAASCSQGNRPEVLDPERLKAKLTNGSR